MNRRKFLLSTGAAAITAWLPGRAFAAATGHYYRLLVLVELKGGNDGLNTVVPYASDDYYASMDDYTEENLRRQNYRQITYNPYQYQSFVYRDTGEPIRSATQVVIIGSHIYLSGRDTTND